MGGFCSLFSYYFKCPSQDILFISLILIQRFMFVLHLYLTKIEAEAITEHNSLTASMCIDAPSALTIISFEI